MAGSFDPRSPDWPVQAADKVVSVVDSIRDKTTVPLTTAARALVYGLIAGVMGIAVVIMLTIAIVRAVDVAIPGPVWPAHLAIGILFSAAGLFALRVANRGARTDK
jgi:hypothetical protein